MIFNNSILTIVAYAVRLSAEADKALDKLPQNVAERIIAKIRELAENPFTATNVKALYGTLKGYFRLRVGDYRILYRVIKEQLVILVIEIGQRQNFYD